MGPTLALAAALLAARASPASDDLPFSWSASAECPTEQRVTAQVEQHLAMPLTQLPMQPWSVQGTITGDTQAGWSLALAIETPQGRTERALFDPHDCAAVSDAAALLIAMTLDPDASEPTVEPTTSAVDTEASEHGDGSQVVRTSEATEPKDDDPELITESPGPVQPATDPEPGQRIPLRFVLGASGGVLGATLRGASAVGQAKVAWRLPRLRVGITATFGATRGFSVPPITRDLSLWMWTVGAEAGPVFRRGPFEFPLLGGIETGQIILAPRILAGAERPATWTALVLNPGIAWVPQDWLAVVLSVGTTISFVRPRFEIEGIGLIHAPSPIGIRATLGLEFRLPLTVMKTEAGGNEPMRP
ncbi:MAG: hypothetical protein AAF799_39885 [Myxococcota bacterium]